MQRLKDARFGIGAILLYLGIMFFSRCTEPTNPPIVKCPCECPPVDTIITNPPVDTSIGREILFGANTNNYQPKEKQAQMQGVRFYLPIGWVFTPQGFYGEPQKQGQKQFTGVDTYLEYMRSQNVDVLLTLMQSPDWLNGQTAGPGLNTNDFPPIRPGLNRELPSSFSDVAGIYKAFSIRYGSRTWAPGSYRIDPAPPRWTNDGPQQFKSGLNLVKFIEVGNEPDRWWDIGTPKYMTPKEYGAMLIAAYDSIKFADPSLQVVMAGLTNFDLKYLTEMKVYCDARGRKFPADIINVHHYSSTGNLTGVHPPTWPANSGCPPELDKDMNSLAKIVTFANGIGLPTWVTEYGYDDQTGSQLAPAPLILVTNRDLQAQWNVRSALEHIRLGASRSYVFTMADEANGGSGTFQTSGLLGRESVGYAEKPAFTLFATMCKELKGFKYLADESTATTRVMKFRHPDGRFVYAYWSPTASAKTFAATIAGKAVAVTETVQYLKTSANGQYLQ